MRSETIRARSKEKEREEFTRERDRKGANCLCCQSVGATVFWLITIMSLDNVNQKLKTNLKKLSEYSV